MSKAKFVKLLESGQTYQVLKTEKAKAKKNRDKGLVWLTCDMEGVPRLFFGLEGRDFEKVASDE